MNKIECSDEDEFLRNALLLANSPQVMGLSAVAPEVSPGFERRMKRLLDNPFRQARRALRPLWVKAARAAAMVVLTLAVTFFAAMLNPGARAWFRNMAVKWQTYGVEFIFRGSAGAETGTWAPGYLPEGFEQIEKETVVHLRSVVFVNASAQTISFDYDVIAQGGKFSIDGEHADHKQITINGRLADLFRSNTAGKPSYLIWTDADATIAFRLMSDINPDELVKIAESVTKIR